MINLILLFAALFSIVLCAFYFTLRELINEINKMDATETSMMDDWYSHNDKFPKFHPPTPFEYKTEPCDKYDEHPEFCCQTVSKRMDGVDESELPRVDQEHKYIDHTKLKRTPRFVEQFRDEFRKMYDKRGAKIIPPDTDEIGNKPFHDFK